MSCSFCTQCNLQHHFKPQRFKDYMAGKGIRRILLVYRYLKSVSEKAMAPYSSTFAWKIPWTEEPGGLQSMGLLESDTTEQLHFHFSLSCIGERNNNPLQCSCLENPKDEGPWWAAVYGVAQSRTWLKRLSSSSSKVSLLILSWKKAFLKSLRTPLHASQYSYWITNCIYDLKDFE